MDDHESLSHTRSGVQISRRAKRKSIVVRRGLKEAWSKTAARWTKTG
jgi:hypothetical protein